MREMESCHRVTRPFLRVWSPLTPPSGQLRQALAVAITLSPLVYSFYRRLLDLLELRLMGVVVLAVTEELLEELDF
jgi:hypothetical protein